MVQTLLASSSQYRSKLFVDFDDCVYLAAWQKSTVLLQLLRHDAKINVNAQDEQGRTLAMVALHKFEDRVFLTEALRMIIKDRAADLSLKDNQGHDVYWYAAEKQLTGFIQTLGT